MTRRSHLVFLLGLFSVSLAGWSGCDRSRRADVAAIKKTYADSRTAVAQQDFFKATNFLSSDYLALYPRPQEKIREHFRPLPETDEQLGKDSWVKFDPKNQSKAWLFLHRAPTVGRGLVKEPSGWKITTAVHPIVDTH
jgi:hypothetical protein